MSESNQPAERLATVNARRQVYSATATAVLAGRWFCWISKPFDVTELGKGQREYFVDSTGIAFRFGNW